MWRTVQTLARLRARVTLAREIKRAIKEKIE